MCYEERFFRDLAVKRAKEREKPKPVTQPIPPDPQPEKKPADEVEREPELV